MQHAPCDGGLQVCCFVLRDHKHRGLGATALTHFKIISHLCSKLKKHLTASYVNVFFKY